LQEDVELKSKAESPTGTEDDIPDVSLSWPLNKQGILKYGGGWWQLR
jgi:hypothetical protein